MILILSKEQEESTNSVIDWLEYSDAEYIRFNGDNFDLNQFYLEISESSSDFLTGIPCDISDVNVVWYRRWGNLGKPMPFVKISDDTDFHKTLNNYLLDENKHLSLALFSLFQDSYWLSKPKSHIIEDKFLYLSAAKSLDITIPNTFLLNNKKKLTDILKSGVKLISKSLGNAHKIKYNNKTHIPYTDEITESDLENLEETFFVSLFQEKIEKEYEIRSFYLDGTFYSMAIFSQFDDKTELDFRRYNFSKPNRTVPYSLPKELEKKLIKLMEKFNFNTGSIDIIKSKNGKYYFLEINPIGQFGMTSIPCNFQIEKKIAEFLISKDKHI
ncbi:grasp-with-spasm system ATP-grasp peptide maturase [uncultured Aquimarina sp.]|uniref:grasp-with-spasm system ATP-grasp peptide maturase n=1 Tax=uncultured Aquimarina sp. TaxID=575652 RepID=UPI00261FE5F1|nr:grasp-with-spasm system ATP-grasp peptide maturase [uncultured Aquimarina sp.]